MAKLAFIEGLDKLCKEVDDDYQEVIKFRGSSEEILKKIEKYKLNHEMR